MRRTRRAVLIALSVVTALGLGAFPLVAASSGTVSTSVEATEACITVEASSVDFGANQFSTTTADEVATGLPDTAATSGASYALENCASTSADFLISGTDAENSDATVTWTLQAPDPTQPPPLVCDLGPNIYRMNAVNDANDDDDLTGDSGIFLSTSLKTSSTFQAIAGNTTINVGNQIFMPCTGSDGIGQTMSSSITYTATLN